MSKHPEFNPKYVKGVPLDKFLNDNEHVAANIDLKAVHEYHNPPAEVKPSKPAAK